MSRAETRDELDERLTPTEQGTGPTFGAALRETRKASKQAAKSKRKAKTKPAAFGASKRERVVRIRLTLKTKLSEADIRTLIEEHSGDLNPHVAGVTRVREVRS